MEIIRTLKGINGQIELYAQKIVIKRKGFVSLFTQGLKGDKTIPFSSITSVQVKGADFFTNGYIQFGLQGGYESKSGIISATRDENTVMFKKPSTEDVQFIKEYIEAHKGQSASSNISVADELTKLKNLLAERVITQADFDNQKKKLLT